MLKSVNTFDVIFNSIEDAGPVAFQWPGIATCILVLCKFLWLLPVGGDRRQQEPPSVGGLQEALIKGTYKETL